MATLGKRGGLALASLTGVALGAVYFTGWMLPIKLAISLLILILVIWFVVSWQINTELKIQNLEGLLLSLKDEDYSSQLEEPGDTHPLSKLITAANKLSQVLREERTGAAEYSALLQKVIEQIDIGVIAFDNNKRITLVSNRTCHILDLPRDKLLTGSLEEIGLTSLFEIENHGTWSPPNQSEKFYQVIRSQFRERGKERTLITITDVSKPMRMQELNAWKKIIKVLRHEISNSLAPIQSYVQTLSASLDEIALTNESASVFKEGLEVIENRSLALAKLTNSYKSLTDLPAPDKSEVDVLEVVNESILSFPTRPIKLKCNGPIICKLDKYQIQQVLVNLIKNADESMVNKHESILVTVTNNPLGSAESDKLQIEIKDRGEGFSNRENLFVPFYTTKSDGEGIGLSLCRLIVERHGGEIKLANRKDGGAVVTIQLPMT